MCGGGPLFGETRISESVYASPVCRPRSQNAINVSHRRESIAFTRSEVDYFCVVRHDSWRAHFDTVQDFSDCLRARLGAEVAFAVDADAHGIGVHVAFSDHKHGMDLHLLGALDFAVDLVGA